MPPGSLRRSRTRPRGSPACTGTAVRADDEVGDGWRPRTRQMRIQARPGAAMPHLDGGAYGVADRAPRCTGRGAWAWPAPAGLSVTTEPGSPRTRLATSSDAQAGDGGAVDRDDARRRPHPGRFRRPALGQADDVDLRRARSRSRARCRRTGRRPLSQFGKLVLVEVGRMGIEPRTTMPRIASVSSFFSSTSATYCILMCSYALNSCSSSVRRQAHLGYLGGRSQ